jgi:hypothetical protein
LFSFFDLYQKSHAMGSHTGLEAPAARRTQGHEATVYRAKYLFLNTPYESSRATTCTHHAVEKKPSVRVIQSFANERVETDSLENMTQ